MKLWKMARKFSQISHAAKCAKYYLIRICRQNSFLIWAFLPLSILAGVTFWFNFVCDPEQLNWLRKTIPRWVENGSSRKYFSEQSFLRVIISMKLAQGVSFALIVASFALIYISSTIAWNRSHPQQRKGTFVAASLIAAIGITFHDSSNPCLSQWYFEYSYQPLAALNPFSKAMANVLIVVSNIAMALLVVAVTTFHQDPSFLAGQKERLSLISAELSDIRRLLYFASAQLTVGAYAIFCGLYMNIAGTNEQERQLLLELVANLTFIYSATYSLVLFAVFYPSFSQIKVHAYKLARECAPALSPKEFLSKAGLDMTTPNDVKDFLVILGPIIASTSASILQHH